MFVLDHLQASVQYNNIGTNICTACEVLVVFVHEGLQ